MTDTPTRVLLIEDDDVDAELLTEMISGEPGSRVRVDLATRLSDAVKKILEENYDIVLSDLNLPDSRGLATFNRVQEVAPSLPILVLSGMDDETTALEAVRTGAQDYLVKGRVNGALLLKSIRYSIERNHSRRELTRIAQELQAANQRLEHMAQNDPLTELLNRRGLQDVLTHETARAHRAGTNIVVLLIDLDDFKRINDTLGHSCGDAVLKEIALRMRRPLRSTDYAARVGGDEFLILLPDTLPAEGVKIAEVVRSAVCDRPIDTGSGQVTATASVGVISVPPNARSIDDLLSETHHVLYRSKRRGKNRVSFEGLVPEMASPFALPAIEDFRKENRFRAVIQPIVRISDGQSVAFEFLSRSNIASVESPEDFFRLSLEANLSTMIDRQCLSTCVAASRKLLPIFRRHINVSPATILDMTVPRFIEAFPEGQAGLYCIEISQHQIVGDPSYLEDVLEGLRSAGFLTAIEDVSFGKNSVESLVLLEPDFIKLDKTYAMGLASDRARVRSLARMLKLADAIGTDVIAEGVESPTDLGALKAAGVKYGQGFLWGRPAPRVQDFRPTLPEAAIAELRSAGAAV